MSQFCFLSFVSPEQLDYAQDGIARLTPRERDVLGGILKAQSSKEIAIELGISYRTVEVYRSRLLVKVGARGQLDVVRFVAAVEMRQQWNYGGPSVAQFGRQQERDLDDRRLTAQPQA